ncbi:MAG: serine/threonine protein kinase [Deltaproteobacteria bacterium]|nr:serine/threonine protein kinase [Deltaproteobacteria bacterium]
MARGRRAWPAWHPRRVRRSSAPHRRPCAMIAGMGATRTATEELRQRAERRVGSVLKDKWKLDRLLGVGGMAAVYAATHRNGKRVAVKILHAERALNENIRRRFLREGYAANKVGHAGAVSVLDDDVSDDGTVFLVMDLLEGETLQARLDRCGPLAAEDVLLVTHHLLDALAAAHDKGIVHRDLKPENVFVTNTGAVKVLDFGIARLREDAARTGATGSDSSLGTPAFMPPEQARGRQGAVPADLRAGRARGCLPHVRCGIRRSRAHRRGRGGAHRGEPLQRPGQVPQPAQPDRRPAPRDRAHGGHRRAQLPREVHRQPPRHH